MNQNELAQNYSKVKSSIPPYVQLVVVSKTRLPAEIESLYQMGQRDFGENRVQELKQKAEALGHLSEIRWHMIGHIQTNKVNELLKIPHLHTIHSIDSIKLANFLSSKILEKKLEVYIEVNIGGEEAKQGVRNLEGIIEVYDELTKIPNIKIAGLMGMAPIRIPSGISSEMAARESFQKLKKLSQFFHPEVFMLSMGMSSDYQIAIEEGSTCVRVGSSIFNS